MPATRPPPLLVAVRCWRAPSGLCCCGLALVWIVAACCLNDKDVFAQPGETGGTVGELLPLPPPIAPKIDDGIPIDATVVFPPMDFADRLDGQGYGAIPGALATEMVPAWPRWFAGASGLVMTRTLPAGTNTMQPAAGLPTLSTASAAATWPGGLDLHVGRWFGPGQSSAIEGIYWGVYGIGSSATVGSAGGPGLINGIPQAPGAMLAGSPAAAFLADSQAQQISRSDLVNNVEINWLYRLTDRPEFPPLDRRLSWIWLAGFRFFELQDVVTQTSTSSVIQSIVPGGNQALLSVATNNNLFGGQLGAKADWRIAPRIRLSAVPKFMVGGNAITNTTDLATVSGTGATFADGTPLHGHSTLGVFSWLGSVDSAVAWDVTDHWSLSVGYRVVGVGNIAQADGQWPASISGPASLGGIDAGSSTVIHGGFAGFQGRY